jgi:hypothetical protein
MSPQTPASSSTPRDRLRELVRRLDLREGDLVEPDALADLGYRVELGKERFDPPAPLESSTITAAPELGEEPWERYPLEADKPPEMEDVSLETDVALGLGDEVHVRKPQSDKAKRRKPGREHSGPAGR